MKSRKPLSTSRTAVVAALAALTAGCATSAPLSATTFAPLDLALAADPRALRDRAESADPEAQLAMSIIAAHGLHGRAPDLLEATVWRGQALTSRRSVPITQYTPAFNGQSSRVNLIYVPVNIIQPGQVTAIDRCLAALRGEDSVGSACGQTADEAEARRRAWAAAHQPRP